MHQNIREVLKVDSIEEANSYLKQGWVLLDSGSLVVENEPKFYFVVGKTTDVEFQEMLVTAEKEEADLAKKVVQLRPE